MILRPNSRLRQCGGRVGTGSRGGGVRAAWSPADLPGVTRLWLPGPTHSYTDTARTTLAGDTDAVAATVDRLQGTVWSEADPLKRMTLRDLGGGQWVWRSDGINDGLGNGPATTGARAIAMAYTQTVSAANTRVLQALGPVNTVVSPRRQVSANLFATGTIRDTAFADDSDPHVFVMSRSAAGAWRCWSDGTSLAVTDQIADFGSVGVGSFTGARQISETFTGDIYAVVDYDPTDDDYLSDTDRAKLTTYLASLYGGVL